MELPTIICVDDEPVILNSLQEQLMRWFSKEYIIEICESPEEALELIDELLENSVRIPLVISDQIMPGMKGSMLLKKVKEKSAAIKTILLTGQADERDLEETVRSISLHKYLAKPWNETELVAAVKSAL